MKELEIEKTKHTFIKSVLKVDIIKMGLVFSISNFFIAKTSLANNWRSFSSSYLALALFGTNFSAIPCSNCTFNSSATRTKRYYPIYKVHCTYLLLIQCLSLHYSALCTAHHKVFKIRDCKVLFLVQNTVAQKIHIIQF